MIEGGHPLSGTLRASGNKNGALPILAACLLTEEPVTLSERAAHPRRRDDARAARRASAPTSNGPARTRCASTRRTSAHEIDDELASQIRASFLLAGPLLARHGRVSVPPPGGDVIGRRRLDPHIHAFAELGARARVRRPLRAVADGCAGAHIHLDEASVMATENAVMAATIAPGRTMISNAASEPHVQDLCRFLDIARREDRRHRLERAARRRRRAAVRRRRTRSRPSTSRSAASSAWPPSPAAT